MDYKKVKSKKDKLKETGLPINYCKITVTVGKNEKLNERSIEMVYKVIKPRVEDDLYFMSKVKRELNITDTKTKFKINKIETIKFMGYGVYEE